MKKFVTPRFTLGRWLSLLLLVALLLPAHVQAQSTACAADVVIQAQFLLLGQQQDAKTGDLFGQRADIGYGGRSEGEGVFKVRLAKAFGINHFSTLDDAHGKPSLQAFGFGVEQGVDFGAVAFKDDGLLR